MFPELKFVNFSVWDGERHLVKGEVNFAKGGGVNAV